MAKQGRSLQDLAVELQRQSEARKDFIAPQGAIEARPVEGGVGIVLDGFGSGGYPLTEHAHDQMAQVLGIPTKYYDRMRAEKPALLADNVNTWLAAEPVEKRMVRTLDGRVRAVLSSKYRPLDNFELAQVLLPKLIELEAEIVSSELTETRMYIKAILPSLSDELPAGQVWGQGHNRVAEFGGESGKVVSAIVVSNSEVGNGSLRIEPSVFTTWCSNLAIMKAAALKKYHVGRGFDAGENHELFRDETRQADDRAFFLKVADIAQAAFDKGVFQAAVQQLRAATADKIESQDLPKVVEVAVRELALPVGTQGSILTYLAQGGDFSRWGLSSAVTATANKFADYEGATALERAGGEILALPAAGWQKIARAA